MANVKLVPYGRYILTLCISFLSLLSVAQEYTVKSLGISNGLSSDFISGMAMDKQGFLWVATEDGLNRFDGSQFINYFKDNGLTGNELNCLLDDSHDPVMWIGTQRDGLDYYNYETGEFGSFKHDKGNNNSLATNDITSLSQAKDGNIYITTYWMGVEYFDKKDKRFVHYNMHNVRGFVTNRTWCTLDAGGGIVYVGHVRAGLSVMDTRTRRARKFVHDDNNPHSISGNDVHCITRDKQGRIWVGTDKGLDLFDPVHYTFTHYSDNGRIDKPVYCIRQLADGKLCICMEQGGIAIMSGGMPVYGVYTLPTFYYITEGDSERSLTGNSVRSVVEDRFHNIWVGLYGGGVNFASNRRQLFYSLVYSPIEPEIHLTNKAVLSMDVDAKGNLWVGTDGDGINIFDAHFHRIPSKGLLEGRSVQVVHRDKEGNMWLGSYYGNLYKLSSGSMKAVFKKNIDVRSVTESLAGLLVGTSSGWFIVNPSTAEVVRKITLPEDLVRCIAVDRRGYYWIGTFGGGAIICDRKFNVVKRFLTSDGFPSNTVNDIHVSKDGKIWLATGGGLVCFPVAGKNSYKVYGIKEHLSNINVRAVREDASGNIWVSTNSTISCLLKKAGDILNYDYNDRISLGNYNAASATVSQSGYIFFGGTNGITFFSPKFVLEPHTAPKSVITSVVINGGRRDGTDSTMVLIGEDKMELPYDLNTFTMHFTVSDYFLSGSVEYAYRLRGVHSNWETTRQGVVTFSNVPYGKYTLEVRSRLHNQKWNDDVATLDINILPPFWLTWWAKLFYVLAACAFAFLMLKQYRHRLQLEYQIKGQERLLEQDKKLNQERIAFFSAITDEVRTPLSLIVSPLESLMQRENISEHVKSQLQVIHQNALKFLELISRINNILIQRQNILEKMNIKDVDEEEVRKQKKQLLESNLTQSDHEFFDKLNKLLDKNISGEIDIEFLTKNLGMSISGLYRKMKQVTGMGTNEYVRHYKMQYAEKLLLEGKYTINEISFMVGMNSVAYFRKCFKAEFGDLPSVYLKKIRSPKL